MEEKQAMDAILFDLDNTLLDRTKTFNSFCYRFVHRYFPNRSEIERLEIINYIIFIDNDGYKNKTEMFIELLEELHWEEEKPEITELMEFYEMYYIDCAELMDSALDLLYKCRELGLKTGLITNGRNQIQYGKIDKLDIKELFDVIIVSEEAGVKKPDERIFRQALQHLNIEPKKSIFVGDHPINDILGASKAGLKTIWMKRNQPWDDSVRTSPLKVIENLNELIDYLSELTKLR
jgi:putative hydrolase of the HAD superfamily